MSQTKRLHSLDIFRGIVIAAMILVNNPGSWDFVYRPLDHAEWNGMTPTDLIFPFFMVIMGISAAFSLKKYDYRWSRSAAGKIFRRTVVLLLIGYATGWLSRFLARIYEEPFWSAVNNFDTARIMGVMVRLALVYLFISVLALSVPHKALPWISAGILAAYSIVLLAGHGFELSAGNIVGIVDRAVLTPAHIYHGAPIDPEGILSTFPAIAQGIIGFLCGRMILQKPENSLRMKHLFLPGFGMAALGWALSYGIPLNKKVWSPTFVLVSSGLAFMNLAFFIWLVDEKGKRNWLSFFESFGMNAMFIFIISTVAAILLGGIQIHAGGRALSIWDAFYIYGTASWIPNPYFASLCDALVFVVLMWLISYPLFRRKIYIKV